MHGVLCESGKQLTIINTGVELSGPQASLKLFMWPALSERLKTPVLMLGQGTRYSNDTASLLPQPTLLAEATITLLYPREVEAGTCDSRADFL